MALRSTIRPASRSFYGSYHMKDLDSGEYWVDTDNKELFEVMLWWDWKERDPRKSGSDYQPVIDAHSEEWWSQEYPYPFDLVPLKSEPIFPVRLLAANCGKPDELEIPVISQAIQRKHFNAFFAAFYVDRLLTYPDMPEVWIGDSKAIQTAREKARLKLTEVEKTLQDGKRRGVDGVVNIALVGFMRDFPEFRRAFFEQYPDADPKFYGFADEDDISTTLCPEHPLYLKLIESQIRELLTACPSLKYLMLTIDDNWGYVRCQNPEHGHKKYDLCNSAQIDKTIEIIQLVHAVCASIRPVTLLCRCWGATLFLIDPHYVKKYSHRMPDKDLILLGKHNAPPSVDNAPNSDQLHPGLDLWPEAGFTLSWGEDGGHQNDFSLLYLYSNPEKVHQDIKKLAATGRTKLISAYAEEMFTHELDSLTLRAACWNPDFDLGKLKQDWAQLRFQKAGQHILNGLKKTPDVLKKLTFYHEGFLQRNSLHMVLWGGVRSGEAVFLVPAPSWLAQVDQENFEALSRRVDPRPEVLAVLDQFQQAKRLEPENAVVDLYLSQAQLTLNLANVFREYHLAFLEYRLAQHDNKPRDAAAQNHIQNAIDHMDAILPYLQRYEQDQTLRWWSMNRRRYFVYFFKSAQKIILHYLRKKRVGKDILIKDTEAISR